MLALRRLSLLLSLAAAVTPAGAASRVAGYPQSHRLSEGRVPVFHALTSFMPPDTGTRAELWARETKGVTPAEGPGFIHFSGVVWFSNPTDMAETLKALDPQTYVPVRPDTMAELYRAAQE